MKSTVIYSILFVLLNACLFAYAGDYCPTLCLSSNGTRSCCPLVGGTCCSAGDFCCPSGFTCDLNQQRCTKDNFYMPFHIRLQSPVNTQITGSDTLCPDKETTCKDHQTCCIVSDGQYGCCPIDNAVCCNDHIHCCPKDYTCNPSQGKCDKHLGNGLLSSVEWSQKVAGTPIKQNSVPCPGGSSQCPDGNTCCQLASGQWGCCPLPNATCCSDHQHCCPNGYTCDVKDGRCIKGQESIPFFDKTTAAPVPQKDDEPKTVPCPGGSAQCPDGNTCCQLASGQWGCCPLENAVCCSDHQHCCPSGYTCDTKGGRCIKGQESIPFFKKTTAAPVPQIEDKPKSVPCPGGSSQCPDGNTCCQLASGQYGCCPLPNATCCSDHQHCCPNGYTCDVKDGRCNKGQESIPFFQKTAAAPVPQKDDEPKTVPCPGGSAQCPDGNTCCQLASGQWGCCPLENAVCCSDHQHCCPSGYTCDTKGGRCIKGQESIPFFQKTSAAPVPQKDEEPKTVPCPGGSAQCPDGNTCCQLASGQWGCCPLENAVCCSDHEHCCPNGYKCDTKGGRCIKGQESIPFFAKVEATPVPQKNESNDVICSDGTSKCPNGTTCCEMTDHQMGCCQHENAVCCDDGIHCCPNGYTCNTEFGSCNKGLLYIPFGDDKLTPAKHDHSHSHSLPISNHTYHYGSVVCPDGYSFCPNGYTCCVLPNAQYGCCPIPNAVCCEDHLHCCPQNTKCDVQGQCCISDDDNNDESEKRALPWLPKISANQLIKDDEDLKQAKTPVLCKDDKTTCDPMSTCCKMSDGSYGCCLYEEGVCCTETSHCCPKNTKCGNVVGECLQIQSKTDLDLLNWHKIEDEAVEINSNKFEKSKINNRFGDQVCPGGQVQCNNGTCCQKADSTYACCPYPNGTCCGTHGYCCPSDYDCDPKAESCTYRDDGIKMNVNSVLCEDNVHRCPDTYTCCPYTNGSFGCCPVPNAVCCENDLHCCPKDFKCQMNQTNSTLKCVQDDIILDAVMKIPSF